jgi:hypothetical protein
MQFPASAQDQARREVELMHEFRARPHPEALRDLALVRERQGKHREALSTWSLLKQRWATKPMASLSSAPSATYGRVADFFMHRIQRKINLAARPLAMTAQLQRRVANAAMQFGDQPVVDQLDLSVQADLDGDGIDELFFKGSNGELGKRKPALMGIAKWNGQKYQVVWRTARPIPFMTHIVDEDGDGWKEIFCGYQPDSDDAATLHFNGKEAMFY